VVFWKVVVCSPNSRAKLMRSGFPPAQRDIHQHSIEQEDGANKPSSGGRKARLCHNHSHHQIPCVALVPLPPQYLVLMATTHSAISQRSNLNPNSLAATPSVRPKPHVVAYLLPNGHQASAQATPSSPIAKHSKNQHRRTRGGSILNPGGQAHSRSATTTLQSG
jgi:hypothetical protein